MVIVIPEEMMVRKIITLSKKKNIGNIFFMTMDAKYVSIFVFLLFLFLEPFFLSELSFFYKLLYSALYASCFGFSFFMVTFLFHNEVECKSSALSFICVFVYTIVLIIVSFFTILFLRLLLDFHFMNGDVVFKTQVFNLFFEVVKIVFFIKLYLFFVINFNDFSSKFTQKKAEIKNTLSTQEKYDTIQEPVINKTTFFKEEANTIEGNYKADIKNRYVSIEEEGEIQKRNFKRKIRNRRITIKGVNKGEEFIMNSSLVIYMKSEGHYLKIFYFSEVHKKIKFDFIRSSMGNVEKNIMGVASIMRVHKSYFINFDYIKQVRVNASGGVACLSIGNIKLPLSKTYLENVKDSILMYYKDKIVMHV